jgi:hypothetical protein
MFVIYKLPTHSYLQRFIVFKSNFLFYVRFRVLKNFPKIKIDDFNAINFIIRTFFLSIMYLEKIFDCYKNYTV